MARERGVFTMACQKWCHESDSCACRYFRAVAERELQEDGLEKLELGFGSFIPRRRHSTSAGELEPELAGSSRRTS